MVKQFLKFGIAGIDYNRFHSSKNPIKTNNVDINKIVISERCPCGKRYKFFIGYENNNGDDDQITSLCIRLQQMVKYVKHFDDAKVINFLNEDKKSLKICNKILEKITRMMIKRNKTKIKIFEEKLNTKFMAVKYPKKDFNTHACQ